MAVRLQYPCCPTADQCDKNEIVWTEKGFIGHAVWHRGPDAQRFPAVAVCNPDPSFPDVNIFFWDAEDPAVVGEHEHPQGCWRTESPSEYVAYWQLIEKLHAKST